MNKLFSLLIILGLSSQILAQNSNQYSPYYLHKKSQFESLPNSSDEIIFLGNSITDGGNWTELFGDLRIKNRGISGDITDGILNRLDEVTESNPLKIFIMIGINDLSKGKTTQEILNNYEIILDSIISSSPSTEIFVESVLPVNNNFTQFKKHYARADSVLILNKKLEKLAANKNQTYIDLYSSFLDDEGKLNSNLTEDGLHLNGKAYLLWKSLVEDYVKE